MLGMTRYLTIAAGLILAFAAGTLFSAQRRDAMSSAIVPQSQAQKQDSDWGSLYTYYEGESFGTKDGLYAVAVIKPGQQIHPPHEHAEEEYLMVLGGSGTWHLNGKESAAKAGDVLYAKPWDVHGINNSGKEPLRFVVWKWNNKGVAAPKKPS
jgi:mannose-6-phosphate isomerase-like protein (cupin superfamily)